MKALVVSSLYYPNILGGAEKVAQNLAEGLAAQGNEAVVTTLSPTRSLEVAVVNGVRVYYLPVKNLYPAFHQNGRPSAVKALWHGLDTYNPFMAASLGRVLDAERPDVVNTHNIAGFSVSAWQAVKKRRIPLVHTAHDYYLLCPRGTMRRNGKNCPEPCADCQLYNRPRRRISRLVDVATADSRSTLDRHLCHGCFPTAEKTPIYNCCEPPCQAARLSDGENRPLRFGFLGRLDPTKGVDMLLRSFLQLPAGQAELVIAGRGTPDYERELKGMVEGRPEIRWLGFVSPDVLLREADVLVVPSLWHDSAPVVVLEGLAYRLPLIGSRRGGIPELMGEGTGWIFDPDESGALTRAMQTAIGLRNELVAMGERALQRARQFSAKAMVDAYLQAYSRAIESR